MRISVRKKKFSNMFLFYIGIIAFMDLIGVGYSQWSGNINIKGIVSTGSLEACFANSSEDNCKLLNAVISFDEGIPGEWEFAFANTGSLPAYINYDRFQSIQDVIAGPLTLKATIILDPIFNNYIEPGRTVRGKIYVETAEMHENNIGDFYKSNGIKGNLITEVSTKEGNIAFDGGMPSNIVNSIVTVSQNIMFNIPLKCGSWQDSLFINADINVNRHVSIILPDTTGVQRNSVNNNDRSRYTSDGNYSIGSENDVYFGDLELGNEDTYDPQGSSGNSNSTYSYILDEKESANLFNNQ